MSTSLSIVIPAYNEAANLVTAVEKILAETKPLGLLAEVIIINDGSRDNTSTVIKELAARYSSVIGINFSRNFGKEAALEAGLETATGDAIVFIDADLQHPVELLPAMVEAWRQGADVVNAKKRSRGEEGIAYKAASKLFYKLFSYAIGTNFKGASDYKLIDRQVADALKQCPERSRFFRGLVAWVGFQQTDLLFDVKPRLNGASTWSATSLIKYSISNLLTFSSLPLNIIAFAGLATSLVSGLLIVQTLIRYFSGAALNGFTTVIISQAAFSGIVLLALGVLALYVGRIYVEQKGRPTYIIKRSSAARLSQVKAPHDRQQNAG